MQGKKSRCPGCKLAFVVHISQVGTTVSTAKKPPKRPKPDPTPAKPVPVVTPTTKQKAKPQPISPFESLATQHMEQPNADGHGTPEQLYLQRNRSLKRDHEHQELDENSMRSTARGIALMLFGLAIAILAFLNLHMPQLEHACPIGAVLGTLFGCAGGILVMIGLLRRMGFAILLGLMPAMLFLVGGVGVGYLYLQGYWYHTYHPDHGWFAGETAALAKDSSELSPFQPRNSSQPPRFQPPTTRNSPTRPSTRSSNRRDRSNRTASRSPKKTQPFKSDEGIDPFNQSKIRDSQQPADNAQPAQPNDSAITIPSLHAPQSSMRFAERSRAFRSDMREAWGPFYATKFPKELMSKPAGKVDDRGILEVYARGNRAPMIGLDVQAWPSRKGPYEIHPVFDRSETALSVAKDGYAVGGFNVAFEGSKVIGIRCVFVKLKGNDKVDTNDFYYGRWLGSKAADGNSQFISGEGNVVFGLFFDRSSVNICGIGLVRAPN